MHIALLILLYIAITLEFERSIYLVQEDSGTLNSLISVIKQEGQITEQVLRLIAVSFDITAEAGISLAIIIACTH